MKKVWNILSTAIPIAIILFCFLGFLFAPNDPSVTDVMNKYQSASAQYPFGTDNMGRCEFSRILAGGWVTIGIVLAGSAIVAVLGSMVGLLLGQRQYREKCVVGQYYECRNRHPSSCLSHYFHWNLGQQHPYHDGVSHCLAHSADDQTGEDSDGNGDG